MSLTWKDRLATVFVGAAFVLYLLSQGGTRSLDYLGPARRPSPSAHGESGGVTRPSRTCRACTASAADRVLRFFTSCSPRSWVVSCSSPEWSRFPVAAPPRWRR